MPDLRTCKVCNRTLEATRENWNFIYGKPQYMTCRDCTNAKKRQQRAYKRNGEGRTVAQTQAGWGSNFTKNMKGFTPGVKKSSGRRIRRNPELHLVLVDGHYMIQLCREGQYWPATDAEVELWLRLDEVTV